MPEPEFFKSRNRSERLIDVFYEAGATPAKDTLQLVYGDGGGSIPHIRFPFLHDRLVFGELLNAYREANASKSGDSTCLGKHEKLAKTKQRFLRTYQAFSGTFRAKMLFFEGAKWTEPRRQAVEGGAS